MKQLSCSWSPSFFRLIFSCAVGIAVFPLAPAVATPARVLIIRHGEKPDDDDGAKLNARGKERARALVNYFTDPKLDLMPDKIFAADPKHEDSSIRSIQTVTPLAKKLNLTIDVDYTKSKVDELVDEIMTHSRYDGKTILICWEHKLIPDIAQAFGAKKAPDKWPGSQYDRVWVLSFDENDHVKFKDLPQHLLAGDSAE